MTIPFSDADIVDVLKSRLTLLYTQNQDLNAKAQLYITLMSSAVGLTGALGVFAREHDLLDTLLLLLMVIIYALGVVIALRVISDHRWEHPVDINDLKAKRLQKGSAFEDHEYMNYVLTSYVQNANYNQSVIADKVNRVRFAHWFTIIVFVLTLIVIAK